jgi:hypothetical protein
MYRRQHRAPGHCHAAVGAHRRRIFQLYAASCLAMRLNGIDGGARRCEHCADETQIVFQLKNDARPIYRPGLKFFIDLKLVPELSRGQQA